MSRSDICSKNFTMELSSYLNSSCNVSTSFTKNSQSKKSVSSYILVLCGVILLTWCIQILWKRRYLYIYSWNIPGPFSLPIIGSAYLFISSKTSDIMETLLEIQASYPELCCLWFGPRLFYGVSEPEHIEKILTSSKALDKDHLYKFVSSFIGEGLITAKETAMGLNMNIQTSNTDFCKNLDRMMEITTYRVFHLWHHLEFTWNWYPLSKEYDKVIKSFKDFTGAVIRKKLEAFNNKQSSKNSIASTTEQGYPEQLAFLDLILENRNFTELELREEVDLFLIAGTDTTASALSCIFTMLGMFQDVQQKVLGEILEIVGPDRRVLPCDLPEMKYTERVIKESLRLFPVTAFFLRTIAADIDAGDVVFPAGSSAFFGSVHIQRNPKYWTDPLKFDPDRFLPENVAKRHPCTYIPFSYGPRNCIGGQYAMMNMKTILATVLRRFKIYTKYKSIEEIKLKINLLLRLKDGCKVWVEAR